MINNICGFHSIKTLMNSKYFKSENEGRKTFQKGMLFGIFHVFADIFQFHILHTFQSKYGN